MNYDPKLIIEAIRHGEARLTELDEERRGVAERLQQLHARLATLETEATSATESSSLTQSDKITLFRSLFRGREDVFPKL